MILFFPIGDGIREECVSEGTFGEEVGGLHKKEFCGLAQVFFAIGVAIGGHRGFTCTALCGDGI